MRNEKIGKNEYGDRSSDPVQQYQNILDAYKENIERLSQIFRKTSRDLVKDPEALNVYEHEIIGIRGNIERLGSSPPGWSFQKSKVIQNLEKAQEELAKMQFFLTYRKSNPHASAESVNHINPCRRHLDLAASLMVLRKSRA